ncbi:hypothetical protein [Gordonia terrae]|uniref:Uncharacterized protein n=2 Tax=Gordonia terrae TaxID=2055 RepID=A0AAD0K5X5_9ACTN|nr:hypothetical protein [Gordonia terrae]ANY21559.1 hypothetical protein BCM27_00815 [Gordonia terrae]AWO82288.1 hypothetical protein DLJ61_00820 [Gordonia terrae]
MGTVFEKGRRMDTAALRATTDDVGAHLSEMTVGDMSIPAAATNGDLGDLFVAAVDRNARLTALLAGDELISQRAAPIDRASFPLVADQYGGGFDHRYRRSAGLMVAAFAGVLDTHRVVDLDGTHTTAGALYEHAVRDAFLLTWNIATAIDIRYQPRPDIVRGVIQTMLSHIEDADLATAVDVLVQLSGPHRDK